MRQQHTWLALAALAVSIGLAPQAAFPQDSDALEEIVVTGSRIRQNPLEERVPIQTLNAEDIERSGLTSLGDLLGRLTSSGSPLTTKFNSSGNFGFPPGGGGIGAGAATVDLRNLGAKRVLVLVDGLRWVSESSASGVGTAVDLNSIPLSIIDRIEVLEDGASAIYGSDAIAGVVNVITKRDFEGLEVSTYVGSYDESGATQEHTLTIGASGDRSHSILSVGYTRQNEIAADRFEISATPIPFVTTGAGGSSGTPQGRFVFSDPNTGTVIDCTVNDGVGGIPDYDPASPCAGDDFNPFDTGDRFNFAQYNLALTPSERINIFGMAEYEFTPNVRAFVKGSFVNRQSVNQAAPEPLFIGPDAGNGNRLDTISVDVTNPFNPFGFTLNSDPDAGPVNFIFAGRRPIEGGARVFRQDVNTMYLASGLVGEFTFGGREFYWDVNGIYSKNRADQIKNGGYNSRNIQQALGPVDECTGDCVPLNFFGGQGADGSGTITQEMIDFIGFTQKDVSEQELIDYSANLAGSILDLPAGELGFAAGFEHRKKDGFFQPDAVVVAGNSAGVPSSPTSGSFTVDEFYAEVRVPILADVPGARMLDFSAAARSSDYSTFGSDTTTKFSVNWRPLDDLLFRATFGEGFRAPSIGELFGSESRFDQTLEDPCSDLLGLQGGTPASQQVVDNCVALGVPGDGSYAQFNPQISVTTGGNRNLEPETSDSYTYGLVYAPMWVDDVDWMDNLSFELTYWKYELEQAIQAIDAQVQIDSCVTTLDPTLCSGIQRTPSGVINDFSNQLTNIGGIDTDGWDFTVNWRSRDTDLGQFGVTWANTFVSEFTEIIPTATGFAEVSREGTEDGDPERGWPEWRYNLIVDWTYGDWGVSWTARFIDELTETCPDSVIGLGFCSDEANAQNELESTMYHDIQATYRPGFFEDNLEISAGIKNAFDEDPPACFSCALNGFDAAIYDMPGRFFYLKAVYRR